MTDGICIQSAVQVAFRYSELINSRLSSMALPSVRRVATASRIVTGYILSNKLLFRRPPPRRFFAVETQCEAFRAAARFDKLIERRGDRFVAALG
jgi:hypothetical protein